MPRIEGFTELTETLRDKTAASRKDDDVSVVVGYQANYAVYVHENMEAHHNVGVAKFLETPARQLQRILADIVKRAKQQGRTTSQALLLAGLRLQRESQLLVPVNTGMLRNSAFTELEQGQAK